MTKRRNTGSVYLRGSTWWCAYRWEGVRYFESCQTADRSDAEAILALRIVSGPASYKTTRSSKSMAMLVRDRRNKKLESVNTGECIYAVCGAGLVKIGWTKTPKKRINTLQTGSPVPLNLIGIRSGARALEKAAHMHFAASRVHGEWFRVDVGDVVKWLESQ